MEAQESNSASNSWRVQPQAERQWWHERTTSDASVRLGRRTSTEEATKRKPETVARPLQGTREVQAKCTEELSLWIGLYFCKPIISWMCLRKKMYTTPTCKRMMSLHLPMSRQFETLRSILQREIVKENVDPETKLGFTQHAAFFPGLFVYLFNFVPRICCPLYPISQWSTHVCWG